MIGCATHQPITHTHSNVCKHTQTHTQTHTYHTHTHMQCRELLITCCPQTHAMMVNIPASAPVAHRPMVMSSHAAASRPRSCYSRQVTAAAAVAKSSHATASRPHACNSQQQQWPRHHMLQPAAAAAVITCYSQQAALMKQQQQWPSHHMLHPAGCACYSQQQQQTGRQPAQQASCVVCSVGVRVWWASCVVCSVGVRVWWGGFGTSLIGCMCPGCYSLNRGCYSLPLANFHYAIMPLPPPPPLPERSTGSAWPWPPLPPLPYR